MIKYYNKTKQIYIFNIKNNIALKIYIFYMKEQ